MDDFNAKKSRAQKFRQDKYHDRPKKRHDSGSHGGRVDQKDAHPGKSLTTNEKTSASDAQKSDGDGEQVESQSQSFSRRKLVSNWDRYEETVVRNFEEDERDSGALFEELLSMPISGGHLKMKHEHEWGKEKSELQVPWFQLDIQAVEKNLSSIPFYERQQLPRCIFSENHFQRMSTRAKQNAALDVNEGILRIRSLSVSNSAERDTDLKDKSTTDIPASDKRDFETSRVSIAAESDVSKENQDLEHLLTLEDGPLKPFNIKHLEPIISSGAKDDAMPDISEKISSSPSQSAMSPTPATCSQPSVCLDDWLDSILDE